jgi:hypothetical protein
VEDFLVPLMRVSQRSACDLVAEDLVAEQMSLFVEGESGNYIALCLSS